MLGDWEDNKSIEAKNKKEQAEELSGKLKFQDVEDKLMHSVMDGDKDTVTNAEIINEANSRGLNNFTPDELYKNMVENYKQSKRMYGQTLIEELTGMKIDYVERNINIPEFKKEVRQKIIEKVKELEDSKLINEKQNITNKGLELASILLMVQELKRLKTFKLSEGKQEKHIFGEKTDVKDFKKDRYKNLALKASIKKSLRRGHDSIITEDLKAFEREGKSELEIIYAIDSSGSMKGEKLTLTKKAGIALAFEAINKKDKVGSIIFNTKVENFVEPTLEFGKLLHNLSRISAGKETNFEKAIDKSIELFSRKKKTKHLMIITDAMPTVGENPERTTLESISRARTKGITVSVIGIKLGEKGREFSEKIAKIGKGRFYQIENLKEMDSIVLKEYYIMQKR